MRTLDLAALTGHTYTTEPGRHIYRDGAPFVSIGRAGNTAPTDADTFARELPALLAYARELETTLRELVREIDDMAYRGPIATGLATLKARALLGDGAA